MLNFNLNDLINKCVYTFLYVKKLKRGNNNYFPYEYYLINYFFRVNQNIKPNIAAIGNSNVGNSGISVGSGPGVSVGFGVSVGGTSTQVQTESSMKS